MPDNNDIPFNQYSLDFFDLLDALLAGVRNTSYTTGPTEYVSSFVSFISTAWSVLIVFSWIASFFLIFGLVYAYLKANEYGAQEEEELKLNERLYAELHGESVGNKRWDDVQKHIASDEPQSWRLAIIEADILLEEVLEMAGYAGNTIGEKLKSASSNTFSTIDQAWRAHRVRNQIAHDGSDFVLTKKIAQDTITQYRMVFEEFGVV